MKSTAFLFIPSGWIIVTLFFLNLTDTVNPGSFQTLGILVILSYFLAVPCALICSIYGAITASRHWTIGTNQKIFFFLHPGLLLLGGYLFMADFMFPGIRPH